MARKKISPATSRIPIGNCEVIIQGNAKSFKCESNPNSLQISTSRSTEITVSVREDEVRAACSGQDRDDSCRADCDFLIINPKDTESSRKCLLKEVLKLYVKELPGMNYAVNTGKASAFLEISVSNGKYCTLLLRHKSTADSGNIVGAITYQIIPADTQYAEIPLAAVSSMHQHKGIGRQLYLELRRRLQDVGICTIFCWGDKESQGFWHKQGFISIGKVDSRGKVRRLPIKSYIRRALCFPGGSILMVSHLNISLHEAPDNTVKLPISSKSCEMLFFSAKEMQHKMCNEESPGPLMEENQISTDAENLQPETHGARNTSATSTYKQNRKRVWGSSSSSFKSKRVKASRVADDESYSASGIDLNCETKNGDDACALFSERGKTSGEARSGVSPIDGYMPSDIKEHLNIDPTCKDLVTAKSKLKDKNFNIMLMDIGDGAKKTQLTKIIEDLGGAVTTDGSLATHVLTGKVRKTLNFCTALCLGAWILSPSWLKASFHESRFVDEMPFILEDEEYLLKFRIDLKETVKRARKSPKALLKGYQIYLSAHVLPPLHILSTIVLSAGGNVIDGLDEVHDKTRAILVACEEDVEEALLAVRIGVPTFSSNWFINCIMKQELDFDAPQFAESL
ncbi:hypothetical protein Dimus_002152 [Dionaea muscipula]